MACWAIMCEAADPGAPGIVRIPYLIRGLVWSEEEATSSVFSSSKALTRSSSRDTSCLRPSSRVKKDDEAS